MYITRKKYNDCNEILILNDSYLIFFNKEIYINDKILKYKTHSSILDIQLSDRHILLVLADLKNIIVDYSGKEILAKDNFSFRSFYSIDKYSGYDHDEKQTIFNWLNISINSKINNHFVSENIVFYCEGRGKLNIYSTSSIQDNYWSYNLSDLGTYIINEETRLVDLQKFIGVHNEILWIKAGNLILLGLNIHNGELKARIDYQEPFAALENLELDKNNNCIFSIGPQHYFEANLETLSYQLFDITSSTQQHQVEMYKLGSWENNLIYFWEGSDNNRFGIFDRNIKEIIWSDQIAEVKNFSPAILSVKHGSNKLYVHDFHNTLHVFEKE